MRPEGPWAWSDAGIRPQVDRASLRLPAQGVNAARRLRAEKARIFFEKRPPATVGRGGRDAEGERGSARRFGRSENAASPRGLLPFRLGDPCKPAGESSRPRGRTRTLEDSPAGLDHRRSNELNNC